MRGFKMKNIKKTFLLAGLLLLAVPAVGTLAELEANDTNVDIVKTNENGLPDNLVDHNLAIDTSVGIEAPLIGGINRAGDYKYRVDFSNGTSSYYNSISSAINGMTSGSTFVLLKTINFTWDTAVVLG